MVTEEQAKLLSQPRVDAQGKPVKPDANPARSGAAAEVRSAGSRTNAAPAPVAPTPAPAVEEDPSKRKVRTVGPPFLPAR